MDIGSVKFQLEHQVSGHLNVFDSLTRMAVHKEKLHYVAQIDTNPGYLFNLLNGNIFLNIL